jgi:hypothetical protein
MYVMKSHSPARSISKCSKSTYRARSTCGISSREDHTTIANRKSKWTWCAEAVPTENDVRRVARCELWSDRVEICNNRARRNRSLARSLERLISCSADCRFVPADSRPPVAPMAASTRLSAPFQHVGLCVIARTVAHHREKVAAYRSEFERSRIACCHPRGLCQTTCRGPPKLGAANEPG